MLAGDKMRQLKVYIDTSVLGAAFDDEFKETTIVFFEQAREGKFVIFLSALVESEIADAPEEVQQFYDSVAEYAEIITPLRPAILLQQAYLNAGVVTNKWAGDALHVATASVEGCDVIVSWNFKHIVHYDKKRKYNALNILHGYDNIDILTPAEVIEYEEEI